MKINRYNKVVRLTGEYLVARTRWRSLCGQNRAVGVFGGTDRQKMVQWTSFPKTVIFSTVLDVKSRRELAICLQCLTFVKGIVPFC